MEKYTIRCFAAGWFRAKRRPGKEIAEAVAKALFDKKELYTAVVENEKGLHAFVQHAADFFYVGFLDELQREYLKYQFSDSEDQNKFFLREAQFWDFKGESLIQ